MIKTLSNQQPLKTDVHTMTGNGNHVAMLKLTLENSWNDFRQFLAVFSHLEPLCGASRACLCSTILPSSRYCSASCAAMYTPRFVPVLVSVVFTYTMVQVIQKWLEVAYFDRLMFIQLISVVIFLLFANSLECWLTSIKGQKNPKRNFSCLKWMNLFCLFLP